MNECEFSNAEDFADWIVATANDERAHGFVDQVASDEIGANVFLLMRKEWIDYCVVETVRVKPCLIERKKQRRSLGYRWLKDKAQFARYLVLKRAAQSGRDEPKEIAYVGGSPLVRLTSHSDGHCSCTVLLTGAELFGSSPGVVEARAHVGGSVGSLTTIYTADFYDRVT